MATAKDFARVILEMNYGELKSVAASFASMKDEDVRPKIETAEEYADLLFDWAESMRNDWEADELRSQANAAGQ